MCQEHLAMRASPHPAILLNAPVGSGKTAVAAALGLLLSGYTTAYMCKILFLSPLVELVKEQVLFFQTLADVLNTNVQEPHRVRVAYRYAHETHTDIRRAKFICATYEHGPQSVGRGVLEVVSQLSETASNASSSYPVGSRRRGPLLGG
jgi:hypothetical protein